MAQVGELLLGSADLNMEMAGRIRQRAVAMVKPMRFMRSWDGLRFYRSGIFLYRHRAGVGDPAAVLRAALAEALVHYYPFAGRIVEASPGRKLIVECTGEGAVFVAPDLGISLDELGHVTGPPVPRHDELLPAMEGAGVVGRPLLYIQANFAIQEIILKICFLQVMHFRCGGFTVGVQICHCLADGSDMAQFATAIAEFAHGVPGAPTVPPVWAQEILISTPRHQDNDTLVRHHRHQHPEYEPVHDAGRDMVSPLTDASVHRSFFYGRRELSTLRALASMPPLTSSPASRFDLIAAFMWKCRATALRYVDTDTVRIQFFINTSNCQKNSPPLPVGYYGNTCTFGVAESTVGDLRRRPFSHTVGLVAAAKAPAMEEGHLQSAAELMTATGRRGFSVARTYVVSDISRPGFTGVDIGWG
uniref:Uncharacterized protein n=1 Tax=Leersia perrieri TaxID=77586 RepID=A0A0D9WD09_9ORYZ